jgi:hypothetical protein
VDKHREWARVLGALSDPREERDATAQHGLVHDALGLAGTVTDDVAGCSVTETTTSGFRTPVASNDLALELDLAQYAAGNGPCVAACRDGRAHSITTMTAEKHYPHFTDAAQRHGVRSSLSLPLPGRRQASALNVYAHSLSAFEDPRARATAELLARCIATLLPPSFPGTPTSSAAFESVRHSRELMLQARTVLAADGLDTAGAFELMRRRSITEQSSIFDVARHIVENGDR